MSDVSKEDEALNPPIGAGQEQGAARRGNSRRQEDDAERKVRKVREGIVSSIKMDKTAVVTVTTRKPHPKYRKSMVRTSKLFAHDESNEARVGDRVRIAEMRPMSKVKRWRLLEILERAK